MNQSFDDVVEIENGINGIPIYILIYVIIFTLCSVVGIFGNCLVIFSIICSHELRQSRNAFIASLASADLMVSAVTMPASVVGILLGEKFFVINVTWCTFTSTICAPACIISMYSIAWISISRYYYIGRYNDYVRYFTPSKITAYIIGIYMYSIVVHIPNHFGWGSTHYSAVFHVCSLDTDLLSYAIFYALILFAAIFVSFIFYFRIYKVISKSTLSKRVILGRNGDSESKDKKFLDEVKIIKTSFKVFVLFLITWTPVCMLILLHLGKSVPLWVYLYSSLLAHSNSTLNFIVYFVENENFRKAAISMLTKKRLNVTSKVDVSTALHQ